MADDARSPIRADVKVVPTGFARYAGEEAGVVQPTTRREDRRRGRAARMWLYRGNGSDDPAVARQVLIEHRRMEWMWQPPFDSWWFRWFSAGGALLFGVCFVVELLDSASPSILAASGALALANLFNLMLGQRIMARRAVRSETALAEAQALLGEAARD